jgi:hypothetical protein
VEFNPSKKSFFKSLLLDFSPVITASVVTYCVYESAHWFLWVLDAGMVLLSLHLTLQTIVVHCKKLYIDEMYIITSSPLAKISFRWSEIAEAVLRERRNVMSRVDHLLMLRSQTGRLLVFNTSTLSPEDEDRALAKVKEKTNLIVYQDKPSI